MAKTTKKETVKAAAKVEAPKAEVKTEVKAEAPKAAAVEKKAPVAKKEAAPAKKTAEKKVAEKKAPAAKKAAPAKKATAATVKTVEIQMGEQSVSYDAIIKKVTKAAKDAKTVDIYVKVDENKIYFVANGETQSIDLF